VVKGTSRLALGTAAICLAGLGAARHRLLRPDHRRRPGL